MADLNSTLTPQIISDNFFYKDGKLFWKRFKNNKEASSLKGDGYLGVQLNKKHYRVHRLIFLMFHGYLPKYIDHVDGNILNNKIENLREATQSQNCFNRKTPTNNKLSMKNICKVGNKYIVQITIEKDKKRHISSHESLEDAIKKAEELRNKYHKQFARI